MSTVKNAMSSLAMLKTVRQRGVTHILYDVTSIQRIGLQLKLFACTLSSAGVRKSLRNLKTPKNITLAREALKGAELHDGSITAVFERSGKRKVTYSHKTHTAMETQ